MGAGFFHGHANGFLLTASCLCPGALDQASGALHGSDAAEPQAFLNDGADTAALACRCLLERAVEIIVQ
jgi:hypothetical protein